MIRPTHTLMFLTFCDRKVVGLFYSITGNTKSKTATNGITGNDRPLILQVTDEFLTVFFGFHIIRGQFCQILVAPATFPTQRIFVRHPMT